MTELAPPTTEEIDAFIKRWERYAGGESKHSQSFLNDLCVLLRVPRPHDTEPDMPLDAYGFEHASGAVGTGTTDAGRIDLYRRGRFILESKQGSWPAKGRIVDESTLPVVPEAAVKSGKGHGTRGTMTWETAIREARGQARNYAQSLPETEPHVPFLLIVDVGYCIELLANFSTHGRHWTPYPVPGEERIYMRDLHNPLIIERLRAIWLDPERLDPSQRRIAVTRDLAAGLSRIATELEAAGHDPRLVAEFLTRCLFAMFAEDVGLLPENGFLALLKDARSVPERMRASLLEAVFAELDRGGWSSNFKNEIRRFNGKLFSDNRAFALSDTQLELLISAARMDWADVEPAIFGTLLERALNSAEIARIATRPCYCRKSRARTPQSLRRPIPGWNSSLSEQRLTI
jgi:hypothetical protein